MMSTGAGDVEMADSPADDDEEMSEEEEIQRAIAMSMNPQPEDPAKKS